MTPLQSNKITGLDIYSFIIGSPAHYNLWFRDGVYWMPGGVIELSSKGKIGGSSRVNQHVNQTPAPFASLAAPTSILNLL